MPGWRRSAATGHGTSMPSNGISERMEKASPVKGKKRMSSGEQYSPGAAFGAEVQKDGEKWTLVLVRELRHPRPRSGRR